MKLIRDVKIYTGAGVIEQGYVRYNEKITETGAMASFSPMEDDEEQALSEAGKVLVPGFVDIHSHGGYGLDSMDASAEEIVRMVREMSRREGITSYFCTTMTQTVEAIDRAVINIRTAASMCPLIRGIHLEGPFISARYKGAQREDCIRKPDIALLKHWQELSGGLIRLVTYAPEEASPEFEEYCQSAGIVLSAGHSQALYSEACASKATHVTHLFNAQRGLNHREPGVAGFGLLTESVRAELICDGIHIIPEIVAMAFRLKGGRGLELITDSMRAKGMPEGVSELGGQTVYVESGTARLEDGTIAGSILTMDRAFRNIIRFTGCSPEDAVRMSSVNQAEEFELAGKGGIAPGMDADFVLMDREYRVQGTVSGGVRM